MEYLQQISKNKDVAIMNTISPVEQMHMGKSVRNSDL